MITVDRISGGLKKDGKSIKKVTVEHAAELILQTIRKGDSLSNLEYFDGEDCKIPFYEAMSFVMSERQEEHNEAQRDRSIILKEQMLQASSDYRKRPSPENKDIFLASLKAFEAIDKHKPDATVNLNPMFLVTDNIWDLRAETIKAIKKATNGGN